jgi:hypothetical protein
MPVPSILFRPDDRRAPRTPRAQPAYFGDLRLDHLVDALVRGREDYELSRYFYAPLHDEQQIRYRQEVLRDLRRPELRACVGSFAEKMRAMRDGLGQADLLRHPLQRQRWLLGSALDYLDAVRTLADGLGAAADVRSAGLLGVRAMLDDYRRSTPFVRLADDAARVTELLDAVEYCVTITGTKVTVSRCEGEDDYSRHVSGLFARFERHGANSYRSKFSGLPEANGVEAKVLDLVAKLFPKPFAALDRFCETHRDYAAEAVTNFDRELQFYLGFCAYIERLERRGLLFCFPEVSATRKEVHARAAFDIVLANKLAIEDSPVVCNDFELSGPERLFVVSGPNQGGKTTFARMFGQLHHLARLGLMVPAESARLFVCDEIFTHFERGENLADLHGALKDDLVRIHHVLGSATDRSVIIVNEIFGSTSLADARFLAGRILGEMLDLDVLGVCVTFIDELAGLSDKTVSLVSRTDADDPSSRTYRFERRPPDGLAHALALAERRGVTYQALRERLAR